MRISDWSSDVCSSDLPGSAFDASPSCPIRRYRVRRCPVFSAAHRAPTEQADEAGAQEGQRIGADDESPLVHVLTPAPAFACALRSCSAPIWRACARSEEHTSELQSLMRISYAVFCLKKKTKKKHELV